MALHLHDTDVARARGLALLAVLGWFTAACAAGAAGIVNRPGQPPIVLFGFLAVPTLGFAGAYALSASFRAFADGIDLVLLVEDDLNDIFLVKRAFKMARNVW